MKVRELYYEKKMSKSEIVIELGTSFKRVKKFLNSDPEALSRHGRKGKAIRCPLDDYFSIIAELVDKGMPYTSIYPILREQGYKGSRKRTVYDYCVRMFGNKYKHKNRTAEKNRHYVLRVAILNHIWSGKPLDTYDKQWVFTLHPELFDIRDAVSAFRQAMKQKREDWLLDWMSHADSIPIPKIKAFCVGLNRDLEAVLNSVKHQENNAVLEGNVNRLKMIKRDMYGRAGYDLLRAKVLRGIVMV